MNTLQVAIIGSLGPLEITLIIVALLLLFGARKLPELARSMGSSITEFKRGLKETADGAGRISDSSSENEEEKK